MDVSWNGTSANSTARLPLSQGQGKVRHRFSFLVSVGHYLVIVRLVVCAKHRVSGCSYKTYLRLYWIGSDR